MVFNAPFNNISFSYIVVVSFIGGGNRSTLRKPSTYQSHWQILSHNVASSTPRLSGIRTHNLMVIEPECIGSCKSNYRAIMCDKSLTKHSGRLEYTIHRNEFIILVCVKLSIEQLFITLQWIILTK